MTLPLSLPAQSHGAAPLTPTPPVFTPRLNAPWVQALIQAGAALAPAEPPPSNLSQAVFSQAARDAVHYVPCNTDFLAAVTKARQLVTAGARRIVFLIPAPRRHAPKQPGEAALYQSLLSFSNHAGRVRPRLDADFAVVAMAAAPQGMDSASR